MADIFLSYAREDREKAERLAKALEGQGWSVFWDRETPVGVSWREHIEAQLARSKCVVVAWSSNSVTSEWVLEEAEAGKDRKVLIPVSLEAEVRPPFGFRTVQAVDIAAWGGGADDRNFQSLLKGLIRLLGDPPTKPGGTERGEGAPTWDEDEELNRRVLIAGGEFLMGSPEGVGRKDERPQHQVRLSSFYLQEHEVTKEEYRRFKPDYEFPEGEERHPAVNVSWEDADAYARWLGGRLPTEAEWEYACRAGTKSVYWSGDSEEDLSRVGWYLKNSDGTTHPVCEKPASAWGLHDMHGNVWEWVADCKGTYTQSPQVDPLNAVSNHGWRVCRGGSFQAPAGLVRSAARIWGEPGDRTAFLGFRVAFDAAPSKKD